MDLPYGYRRWEFMLFPGEDAEAMLKSEKVHELLTGHVPDPAALNIVRARVHTHHSRVAARFLDGRICLVGDAAHLMPPWAGQGMNTGIRDATNVDWKLAAVVTGRAHPRVLATYDTERREHAKAMVGLSDTLGRLLSSTSTWAARARDAVLRGLQVAPPMRDWLLEMRFKPMPRYTEGVVPHRRPVAKDSAVGRMIVQPYVETADGRSVLLDDVLGEWFTPVGHGTDPLVHLDPESRAFWDRIGTRYVTVVESRSGTDAVVLEDRDGALRKWFAGQPGSVAVVRPDRYVAAVADPAELAGLSGDFERLLSPRRPDARAEKPPRPAIVSAEGGAA